MVHSDYAAADFLTQQLKELGVDGFVTRKDYHEIPPRVTDFGLSLARALAPLCAWGEQHAPTIATRVAERL